MARIFDVGPLPQITPPSIIDTKPIVPFDFANMAQAANQKDQLDRQKEAMELNYLYKFSDDLEGLLKSPDGSFLNPISKYHQKTFEDVATQTTDAVEKMTKALDSEDYKGAYGILFDAKATIKNNTDYKRTLQELSLFKDRLGDKDLDPFAINKLYEELGQSDKAFDLTRFNRSELAMYDEAGTLDSYTKAIAAKERSVYEAFPTGNMSPDDEAAWMRGEVKYLVQQTPESIRTGLKDLIASDPAYQRHLKNHGVNIDDPKALDAYVEGKVHDHLLTSQPGAEYQYAKDADGNDIIVGTKARIGASNIENIAEQRADLAKKKGEASGTGGGNVATWEELYNGPDFATQGILRNTPEIVDLKSYQNAYRGAFNNYYNQSQAVDKFLETNAIVGLTKFTDDKVADIIDTVTEYGIEGARKYLSVVDKEGKVDKAATDRFFNNMLPSMTMAYANKQIYAKGSENLLKGSYDKVKAEYDKKGLTTKFDSFGITKGENGEAIFPPGFDPYTKDSSTGSQKDASGRPQLFPQPAAGQNDRNELRDIFENVAGAQLKDRYEKFIKQDGDVLKGWTLPQETGEKYAPIRAMVESATDIVMTDQQSFYSSDESLTKGLPMTMQELRSKEPPVGVGDRNWDGIKVQGYGLDPETGQFFLYAYPRTSISKEEFDAYDGQKDKTKFTNQITETDGSKYYIKSKKGIMIPWNHFGTNFYQGFFNKYKTYEGLYDGLIQGMEEKVPEGQPVKIQIGDKTMFITPKGPLGGQGRIYQAVIPAAVVPHVESKPLPDVASSSAPTPPKDYVTPTTPPAPVAPEVKQKAEQHLRDTIEARPYLKDLFPELVDPLEPVIVDTKPSVSDSGSTVNVMPPTTPYPAYTPGTASTTGTPKATGPVDLMPPTTPYPTASGAPVTSGTPKAAGPVELFPPNAELTPSGNKPQQAGTQPRNNPSLFPPNAEAPTGSGKAETPKGQYKPELFPTMVNPMDKIYEGDIGAIKQILENGASYIDTLTPDDKAKILDPANFESLEFKDNEYGTNKPMNVHSETASALVHYDDYIKKNYKQKSVVTDTFRTEDQNSKTPGSGAHSKHKEGKAFDIRLNETGKDLHKRVEKAKKEGKEALDKLYIEMFGTSKVSFEYHEKGSAPHIHVTILD